MKKSSLFFIASILGLASLTGVASLNSDCNSIQGARATGVVEDGFYFIKNNSTVVTHGSGVSPTASLVDDITLGVSPLYVEYKSGNTYNIYYTVSETKYYLSSSDSNTENLAFRTASDLTGKTKDIDITFDGEGKVALRLADKYNVKVLSNALRTTSSEVGYIYDFISVSSFISGMATIPCEGYTDTDEKSEAWKSLGNSLDITVKNYLKGIECDKSASLSTIEGSLAKYDYVIAKYSDREKYPNFLDRDVKDIHYFDTYRIETKKNNNSGYLLIGVISISIVIMGITLLNIRKKKEH